MHYIVATITEVLIIGVIISIENGIKNLGLKNYLDPKVNLKWAKIFHMSSLIILIILIDSGVGKLYCKICKF